MALAGGLRRVGARPTLGNYLTEAWQRRDFAIAMAKYRIEATNQINRLGVIWLVLQPIINAAVYGFIFGVLQGGARPHNYISFVVIGVFLFQFFSASVNQGAKSITNNRSLVQSLAFPRITLPAAVVIEQFITLLATLPVMFIIVIGFGARPHLDWLLLVPLMGIFAVFTTGVVLICARLTVMLTDLAQLLPFIIRLLFYTSGVLFQVDRLLKGHPRVVHLFNYHPVYEMLSLARGLLIPGKEEPAQAQFWFPLIIWAIVASVIGVAFFWSAEERYGRIN